MKTNLSNMSKRKKRAVSAVCDRDSRKATPAAVRFPHPLAGFEPVVVRIDRCEWVEPWVEWYRDSQVAFQ
jgi:hypothetical protein